MQRGKLNAQPLSTHLPECVLGNYYTVITACVCLLVWALIIRECSEKVELAIPVH